MTSAKCFLNKFAKFIVIHSANLIEALTTGVCSMAAFACLFILDGWVLKLMGFVGFFLLAYLVAYTLDKVKGV